MFKKVSLSILTMIVVFMIGTPVYAAETYNSPYNYNIIENEETDEKNYYATISGIEAESKYDYLDINIPATVKKDGKVYNYNAAHIYYTDESELPVARYYTLDSIKEEGKATTLEENAAEAETEAAVNSDIKIIKTAILDASVILIFLTSVYSIIKLW